MTRALVIGGAGFIGVAACKELMRRGVETVAAGRTPRPYGTFTSFHAFDRRDPGQLRAALEKVRPDVVLDLAAYRPDEVAGMVAAFGGERYVFVSTGVYPDLHGRAAAEDDFVPLPGEVPDDPNLEYREGKRWCETVLARSGGFYKPTRFVEDLAPLLADPSARVSGFHLYTFNAVDATESWRQTLLESLVG